MIQSENKLKSIFLSTICTLFFGCIIAQNLQEAKISGVNGKYINPDLMIERGIFSLKSEEIVVSFKTSVSSSGTTRTFKSNSNLFGPDFISFCPFISSGSKIIFDSIVIQTKSKTKVLSPVEYVVKRDAPYCFFVNNKYKNEYTVDELIHINTLQCFPSYYQIKSFDLLIFEHEKNRRFSSSSNSLTNEMVDALKLLKGAEIVWFENIELIFNSFQFWAQPFKLSIIASSNGIPCTLNAISFGEWKVPNKEFEYELKIPSKDFMIESFSFTTNYKGVMKTLRKSNSSKLSPEMVDLLTKSAPSTVIKIDQIKIKNEEGARVLDPIYIRIPGDSTRKAVLGKTYFGEQPYEYIKSNPKITVDGQIVSSFMVKANDLPIYTSSSGLINEDLLQVISKLPKGTVLYFYNIFSESSQQKKKSNDIWIKIK